MNIYWFELFLTVMQGDIGDTGEGGGGGGNWIIVIVTGVEKSCSSTKKLMMVELNVSIKPSVWG